MRLHATRGFLIAALIGGATMGACSLNTQPIPPGEQPDGGQDFGGSGLRADASVSVSDSGTVTGNPAPGDAGDASGDASDDGGDEDAGDAATDAGDE
ncbi:MAG: hypothetical protein ABI183_19555 [Polyangiaceae bacterium]